jgi:hypothetical protein
MDYKNAEILLNENLSITGNYSQLKSFPFFIKHLVIVPKNEEFKNQLRVYEECTLNGYDNKEALIKMDYIHHDLDILIIGEYSGFTPTKLLRDYLEELINNES